MRRWSWVAVAALSALFGCSGGKSLDREALMKPESCEKCHAGHLEEWSGSMHAYAADDPVFLAMNEKGQADTGGALGDFCVRCHAPMAVLTGATSDGLNLASVPQHLKGVTCYFCHSVASVDGAHNNPLSLADDDVLRGAIADPVENTAHESGYSPFHDRDRRESADMCGACHDIVTPAGVHLERTYAEWQQTLFGNGSQALLTCGNCHMPGRSGPAADFEGVKVREIHAHTWPAVDVALTPFAQSDAQRLLVQDELDSALIGQLCVKPPLADTEIDVVLENGFAGHNFPSGATQDRRVWVELRAFEMDVPIFESGVVAPDQAVAELADPNLWLFRDRIFDAQGGEVHMFWEAASFESVLLPQASMANTPHTASRTYRVSVADGIPDRVTMKVWMRPMGREVLAQLPLDPAVVDALPTFTVLDTIEWTMDDGFGCVPTDPFSG